jgi:hypothetical protein
LQPLTNIGPQSTGSASQIVEPLQENEAVVDNWLLSFIDELHGRIPEDAWAKVPDINAGDIDEHLYIS